MVRTSAVLCEPAPLAQQQLLKRYSEVRTSTVKLAEPLNPEDQMVQSMSDASPTKWHLAHTTWFFETFILAPHVPDYVLFDVRYQYLFNSYYKQLGGHPERAIRGNFSRPELYEVLRYRYYVDTSIQSLFDREVAIELMQFLELGLNHEQQHQELIVTDIKHAFWSNPLRPSYLPMQIRGVESTALPLSWVDFEGGDFEAGHHTEGFAFDNELPRHRTYLRPFRIASRLVTNAEYLEFMLDGGYLRPELWLSDAWDHLQASGWTAPCIGSRKKISHGKYSPVVAGHPCIPTNRCVMSAFMKQMLMRAGRVPVYPRKRSGSSLRSQSRSRGIFLRMANIIRLLLIPSKVCNSFTAMFGNGPPAPMLPIRAIAQPAGRSANITESSCVTRWY